MLKAQSLKQQDLIDFFKVDVMAHMISKAVVLFFLERLVIEGARILTNLLGIGTKQEVDKGSIVEDAMDVGAHALVANDITIRTAIGEVEQWRGLGITKGTRLTHVDLVAL